MGEKSLVNNIFRVRKKSELPLDSQQSTAKGETGIYIDKLW